RAGAVESGEILDSFFRGSDDGPSAPHPAIGSRTGGFVNTTLLGVDDSKTMRKVLEITFAGENFRTVLAESAESALAKLASERPEVVLVDAALDGVNGYDLCARVKATAPRTAVILLASKHQPYDRNRGAEVGADDYI